MSPVSELYGISLPPRYEIRQIGPEHEEWCRALLLQGLLLRAPVWAPLVPAPRIKTALRGFTAVGSYYAHSLLNGLTYGIFDKEYQFKRPESAKTGGAVYWSEIDPEDPELETRGEQWMLDKMDFPIVCLALSYDMFCPTPKEAFVAMATLVPLFGKLMAQYGDLMSTIEDMPKPTAEGQYIHRSGCVTRAGYEGRGLGKALMYWVMWEMAARGYRGMEVGAGNLAVQKAWLHPDAPFQSRLLLETATESIEFEDEGRLIRPFMGSGLLAFNLLYCDFSKRNPHSRYEVRT